MTIRSRRTIGLIRKTRKTLFLKNVLYEVKASGLQLCFNIF